MYIRLFRQNTIGIVLVACLFVVGVTFVSSGGCSHEDQHAEHGEEHEDEHEDEHGDEQGDEHGEEAPGAAEENHVELSAQQREDIGLEFATARPGSIAIDLTFPGEVILNPDQVVHVVPRAAGIVRTVSKTVGDQVKEGDILAWIESDELAKAKLDYYSKLAEVGCCQIELPRAREIFDNTNRLLVLLEKEPSQEEMQKLDGLEMGEYRGKLVKAYSDYEAAKKTYERVKGLYSKMISSGKQMIEAESVLKQSQAAFLAAKDTARYKVLVAFGEAARKRQVAEFEAVAAEKHLRLKGVGDDVVEKLRGLVPNTATLKPCVCDDPECEEGKFISVLETLGEEKRFGWYALRAPFAGVITQKHLTLGEKVSGEQSVFTIADTSAVWVRFSVYQKDLSQVKPNQEVSVILGSGIADHKGKIAYLAPVIDAKTRTAQARVVLNNTDGTLRPGLYAKVRMSIEIEPQVVISKSAVQVLYEKEVVFVEDGDGFVPVPVTLGQSDRNTIEVTAGLKPGQRYVNRGGFELKAKIVTGGLGAHAGHGH